MTKLLSLLFTFAHAEETVEVAETVVEAEMSLLSKGLIVTAAGLAGVFLVLLLFFITIKAMQKLIK